MTGDEREELLTGRMAEAGRALAAFGEVGEDEARALGAGVRERIGPRPLPRLRLAIELGGLGLALGLALVTWLAPRGDPAGQELDVDGVTLALLDEVESIAYPDFDRTGAGAAESAFEDVMADVPDWLVQGRVAVAAEEDYPAAYEWLDRVLAGDVDSELL